MSGRRVGAALALGIALALLFDLLLQFALSAVRIAPSRANWQGAILSKMVWLIAVALAAWIAPRLLTAARHRLEWSDSFQIAGVVLMTAPLIWIAATLMLIAIRLTLTGAWGSEGPLFLHSAVYAEVLASNGPWVLAGAALKALSLHVPPS